MSSLLDRIANRLDRLRAPEPKRAGRAKPHPEPSQAPAEAAAPAEPPTVAGLTAALDKLADERMRQLAIVNGAEAERDRIMDADDGDDAELLELDRRVALARLALDRLARLENEAYEQLEPLQWAEKSARWDHARDEYLKLMKAVHTAMQAYEIAANRLWSVRSALFEPTGAPGWDEQVPRLPHFARAIPGGTVQCDSHQYAADAARFSTLQIGKRAPINNYPDRLSRYIEGRLDLAAVTPPASTFGMQGIEPADHPVLIRLARSITLPEGKVLDAGQVVKVRAAHARELVAANRAVLSDTLLDLAGFRPSSANLPLTELPLPGSEHGA